MKLLLALTTLLAAAAAALAFPEMKKLLALIPFALLALTLAGCSSGFAARLAKMPDGQFSAATLKETGKFTSTEITMAGVTKDNGLMTAKRISITHTNPWLIKFEFTAEDYVAQLTAAEKKKLLSPLLGAPAIPNPPPAPPRRSDAPPAQPAPL